MTTDLHHLDPAVRTMLLEDLPQQARETAAALAVGDFERARNIAHTIRGSAAFCRFEALRNAAELLETAIREGRSESNLEHNLMQEVEAVLASLRIDIKTSNG